MGANTAKQTVELKVQAQIEEWEISVVKSLERKQAELRQARCSKDRADLKLEIEAQIHLLDVLRGKTTNKLRSQREEIVSLRMQVAEYQNLLRETNDSLRARLKIQKDMMLLMSKFQTKQQSMACDINKWKSEVDNLTDKLQEAELRRSLKEESNSKLTAQMQEAGNQLQQVFMVSMRHTEVQQTEKSSEELENITSSSLLSRQQQDQAAEGPDILEILEAAIGTEPSEKLQETENRSRDILNAAKKPRESLKPKEAAPEHPNILASPNESDDSKEETEEDEVDALQTSQVTNTVTGCSETSTEQITVDEAHVEEQEEEENKEESPEVEKTDGEKKKTSPKWRRRLARIFTFSCAGGEHEDD